MPRISLEGVEDLLPTVTPVPMTRSPVPPTATTQFITDTSGNLPTPVAPTPRATMSLPSSTAAPADVPYIAGQGPGKPIPVQPRTRTFPEVTPAPKPPIGMAPLAPAQPSSTAVVPVRPTVSGPEPPGSPGLQRRAGRSLMRGIGQAGEAIGGGGSFLGVGAPE